MADFIARRGAFAVFVARLIPGIRLMAGSRAGYAIGYGLGEYVERLQKFVGQVACAWSSRSISE